jgi:PAS domain S-box-containing protein
MSKLYKSTLSVLVVEVGDSASGGVVDHVHHIKAFTLEVKQAGSEEEALDLMANQSFDICVVESNPGPESGLEFVSAALRDYPHIPFILVTRKVDSNVDDSAFLAGAKDLIGHNELSPERLARSLRFVVNQSRTTTRIRDQWEMVNGLLTNLGEVLWIFDQTRGYYLEMGEGAEALTGYAPSAFLENPDLWDQLVDPQHREKRRKLLDESETDRLSELAYTLTDKKGRNHPIKERVRRVLNTNGSFWVAGVSQDVTLEEKSQSKLALFQQVMQESEDSILITDARLDDPDGPAILYVNPAFTRMTGYEEEEAIGKSPSFLQGPKTDRVVLDRLKRDLQQGEKFTGETINYRKDGSEYLVNWNISPIRDADGKVEYYASLQRDVTQERKLEAEQARAQRLESMGNLVGGVAHDLNNILSPIMLGAGMLKEADTPEQRAILSHSMLESSKRAAGVVGQLLAFARGGNMARKNQRLDGVMQEVYRIARETFPRNIDVRLKLDKDLWVAHANSNELQQVILNLAVNAKDSLENSEKGLIRMAIHNQTVDEKEADNIVGLNPGDYVVLQITDNGPGMPPEILDRIFDPFFTTKEEGKGTGLGLSSALGIVHSHYGCVDVESQPGEGTCFTVYLPAQPERAEEKEEEETPFLHGNGQQILVVDDEPGITELIVDILNEYGYVSQGVTTAQEAIKLFQQNSGRFDLLLTDVIMPEIDGAELVRRVHTEYPNLPVIAMSGYVRHEKIETMEKAGVTQFLSKPIQLEQLLRQLNQALTPQASESRP